jgi:polyphosphate glucokinase
MSNIVLGVDVGGSGIKGALVDVQTGKLTTERKRFEMPQNGKPQQVAELFTQLVKHFDYKGPVGVGFPAIIKDGASLSAANIDDSWIGCNVQQLFSQVSGQPVCVLNDADAAGLAEMEFGAGKGEKGTVIMITLGTGLGSAVFIDGVLLPNTELGHVFLREKEHDAEFYASIAAKEREDLSWKKWGKRLDKYLSHLNFLFSPHLIILGGGESKSFKEFSKHLSVTKNTKIIPAELLNGAGTVGAAVQAFKKFKK